MIFLWMMLTGAFIAAVGVFMWALSRAVGMSDAERAALVRRAFEEYNACLEECGGDERRAAQMWVNRGQR